MSVKFERFAKMVKEEFGLTIVKTTNRESSTFESLFGVSSEDIAQYELPYNTPVENMSYYGGEFLATDVYKLNLPTQKFNANELSHLAA